MTILRDTWVAVGASGLTARDDHTAVSTGTDVIIWGGRGGVTYSGNGSVYHPLENSWTPVSGTGAPSPRRLHCAVWTGKKMFIWGGYDGSTYLGNGGLYDPDTNSWQTVSSLNAPSSRMDVRAVWTGSRVVVWGGYAAGGSYLDTGGRYDPESDTWISTNTSSLPDNFGRRNLPAALNGSGMFFWGGYSTDYQYLNDGGIYYPASDSWTFTTTGGAPAERHLHTGVWCGDRFVVWGGYNSTYLASGAYYRSGGWTPINTGAPAARQKHSAVWDGKQMTVWGGEDTTSTVTQTGSRLDPASRIWSSTSTTGAPSARRLHSATWVGAGMVIWGGSINTGGSTTNTGGRYLP